MIGESRLCWNSLALDFNSCSALDVFCSVIDFLNIGSLCIGVWGNWCYDETFLSFLMSLLIHIDRFCVFFVLILGSYRN